MERPKPDDAARLRLVERDSEAHQRRLDGLDQAVATAQRKADAATAAVAKLTTALESVARARAAGPAPADDDQGADDQAGGLVSWFSVADASVAEDALADLEGWVRGVYVHYPDAVLTDCWRRHAWVVEELLALRDGWEAAWSPEIGNPTMRMDWHGRHRPDTAKRLRLGLGECGLATHGNLAGYRTPGLPGLDQPGPVAGWWAGTHGSTVDPAPTPDALAEAKARRDAERQAEFNA